MPVNPPDATLRVVIAEDAVLLREGLSRLLTEAGMDVAGTAARPRLRVVIAEDAVLLREGLGRLLAEAGLDVAGTAGNAEQLLQLARALRPDVVLADVRMPPTQTTEGLQAAVQIRRPRGAKPPWAVRLAMCGPVPNHRPAT